jgi:hypothetical protein
MDWLKRFIERHAEPTSLQGRRYRVAFNLYSQDGLRQVEVLKIHWGPTYIIESELGQDGIFRNRHGDSPVGPFASPKAAERFIVATDWFCGRGTTGR